MLKKNKIKSNCLARVLVHEGITEESLKTEMRRPDIFLIRLSLIAWARARGDCFS